MQQQGNNRANSLLNIYGIKEGQGKLRKWYDEVYGRARQERIYGISLPRRQ